MLIAEATRDTACFDSELSHSRIPHLNSSPNGGIFRTLTASSVSTRTMLNHASLGRCRHARSQAARQRGAKFVVRASAEVNVTSTKYAWLQRLRPAFAFCSTTGTHMAYMAFGHLTGPSSTSQLHNTTD